MVQQWCIVPIQIVDTWLVRCVIEELRMWLATFMVTSKHVLQMYLSISFDAYSVIHSGLWLMISCRNASVISGNAFQVSLPVFPLTIAT